MSCLPIDIGACMLVGTVLSTVIWERERQKRPSKEVKETYSVCWWVLSCPLLSGRERGKRDLVKR